MTADSTSPLILMTKLGHRIGGMLAALDIDIIGRETAQIIAQLKHLLIDARLDIRDYEMSDSRVEMIKNARVASKRLGAVRTAILAASEHGIFSAIQVATLSAELDEITALLE